MASPDLSQVHTSHVMVVKPCAQTPAFLMAVLYPLLDVHNEQWLLHSATATTFTLVSALWFTRVPGCLDGMPVSAVH